MKKILKNTLALATIATCTLGFVGCGENNTEEPYTAENAYVHVYNQLENVAKEFIQVDGATVNENKNTLNIDFNVSNKIKSNIGSEVQEAETNINLKGLIQSYYGNNHQLYADLNIKKGDEFEKILSAYIKDDFSDSTYTNLSAVIEEAQPITAEIFEQYKENLYVRENSYVKKLNDVEYEAGKFYKQENGEYVHVDDEVQPEGVELYICNDYTKVTSDAVWSADTDYYVLTSDFVYAYLDAKLCNLNSFEQLTVKPEDWEFNYNNYYHTIQLREIANISEETAPEFVIDKYFKLEEVDGESSYTPLTEKPADWDTNFSSYFEEVLTPSICRIDDVEAPEFDSEIFYENKGLDVRDFATDESMLSNIISMLYDNEIGLQADYIQLLDIISNIPDTSVTEIEDSSTTPEEELGIMQLLELIPQMKNFNTFKLLLSNEDGTCDWTFNGTKDARGNVTFSMSYADIFDLGYGITETDTTKIDFIAYANGTIEISIQTVESRKDNLTSIDSTTTISLKLSHENKFDNSLIPNLEEYGELININDLINNKMA